MHIRRQKAAFAAAVKAFAVQRVSQKLAAAQAGGNSVSQLYFTTCTWLLGFQGLHHVRREDVTPNHAPVRRGVFCFGLFYDGFNLQRIAVFIQRANNAVLVHFRQGHFFYRQHSFVGATVYFSHLRQCARGGAVNQIIGQQHCERLIGLQQIGCTHYRMPQAQRLRLAGKGVLAAGMDADLCVFDPEALQETGTYQEPCRMAAGMDTVLAAGVPVLEQSALTGARPGRIIRR